MPLCWHITGIQHTLCSLFNFNYLKRFFKVHLSILKYWEIANWKMKQRHQSKAKAESNSSQPKSATTKSETKPDEPKKREKRKKN